MIAHPDDEAMFFVPSILDLQKKNNLYLLCLSTGNADGLGRTREKELHASAKYLGFVDSHVVDDPHLQDGKDKVWESEHIANQIRNYLTMKQGELEITFVVTFDKDGVSNHPNHIAVHHGVA